MPILQLFCCLFLVQLPTISLGNQWTLVNAKVLDLQQDSETPYQQYRRRNNYRAWASRNSGNGAGIPFTTSAKDLQKKVKKPPSVGNNQHQPLSVKLGFYIESLGDFRETQMSFDVDLYMYMSWKQANFHEVTVPNFNLFIAPDGTVAYSSRVTLTVACHLNLVDYPMDYQQCHIRVLSYAYIAKIVNVTWFRNSPIMYNPEIDLPEFEIDNMGAEYCDGTYRYAVTDRSFKTDRFSCLMGNLYLRRRIGFNMVQSYIPTGLIVIISWVSFWIDRRAVPARVTLSFTTLLTMTTIGKATFTMEPCTDTWDWFLSELGTLRSQCIRASPTYPSSDHGPRSTARCSQCQPGTRTSPTDGSKIF